MGCTFTLKSSILCNVREEEGQVHLMPRVIGQGGGGGSGRVHKSETSFSLFYNFQFDTQHTEHFYLAPLDLSGGLLSFLYFAHCYYEEMFQIK